MQTYVLANSYAEFSDWCARNGVHPAGVTCVTDPRSLRGKVAHCDQVIDARPGPLLPVPPIAVKQVPPQLHR